DHPRVLAHRRRVQLRLEQLRRTANAAERILDLVRQVAHQLAIGLRRLEQSLLAIGPPALVEFAELEQQHPGVALQRDRADRQLLGLASRALEHEVAALLVECADARLDAELLDRRTVDEQPRE